MKRRILAGIALFLIMALLSATFAAADAPETPEEDFVEIEIEQDGEGEALEAEGLILEDETAPTDDLSGDALALDGLLDLDLELSEEALSGETEEAALALSSDGDTVESNGEGTTESVTVSDGMDNDELFEAWMKQRLPGMTRRRLLAARLSGRASLDGINLKLYDALVPMIREVAEGSRTSTKLMVDDAAAGLTDSWWTAEQLGLESLNDSNLGTKLLESEGFDPDPQNSQNSTQKIMGALLVDYPYELYWFDKLTGGMYWSYSISKADGKARLTHMTANMAVSVDYSKTGEQKTYEVNSLPEKVTKAVNNINTIISENTGKDDLPKLETYANEICRLVKYNSAAASDNSTPYGDPWQLVFIFDGDKTDDTNVVCEGYSKGFKYLCDLSSFKGDVYCELMSGRISAGNHMWNAVHMPDGRNYLVDLTNSDGGETCNKKYFLKGCQTQTGSTVTCGTATYSYDEKALTTFSDEMRTMSPADYGKGYAVKTSVEHGTLTASPEKADAGATVTLTVTPDDGYVATAPTVLSFDSQSVSVQQAGENKWQFTMPCGDVTVSAGMNYVYSASGYSGVYDGNGHGVTVNAGEATVSYGTARGAYDLSQSPTWKDVGTHTVYFRVQSGGDVLAQGEAAVAITPNTVGLNWSNTSFTYDGSTHIPTATATGLASGDSCAVTVSGGQKNAGSHTATATGLSNGNYALPKSATCGFTIAPRTVGLNWSNTSFTYDGSTHIPTATATGLASGDSCAVTVSGGQKNAGSHTATATGLSNGNYALPKSATCAFTIAKRTATLAWKNTSVTYNGKVQSPSATVGNLASGVSCAVTVSGGQKNAGSHTAKATGLSNGNYALPKSATCAFTIAKRTADLVWVSTELPYSGGVQAPEVKVGNLAEGDACAVTVTGGHKERGSYTAKVTGLSNANYALPGSLTKAYTIVPKTVGLVWSNTSLVYNGKTQQPKVTLTGVAPGEVCKVTMTGSRKKAGKYVARVTKLSNPNYALPGVRSVTCTIEKKTVKLKWSKTRVKYNKKAQSPKVKVSGLVKGDKCKATLSGAKKKKKGTYTVRVSKLSNSNYKLPENASVKFTIY